MWFQVSAAADTSETSVNKYQITQRNNQKTAIFLTYIHMYISKVL
jgi:hypothetical protein